MRLLVLGLAMAAWGQGMRLELTGDASGIRAVLRNRTPEECRVLLSPRLQPSRLVILGTDGKEIPGFDNRTRAKFDRTVRRSDFQTIPQGGTIPAGEGRFTPDGAGRYVIRWGEFVYSGLPAGPIRVRAEFESSLNRTTAGEAVERVWTGKIASSTLEIRLGK